MPDRNREGALTDIGAVWGRAKLHDVLSTLVSLESTIQESGYMLTRISRKLAVTCNVSAFNLSDLTRPESTRFRTVLSGIMNFAKFRYVRLSEHNAPLRLNSDQ